MQINLIILLSFLLSLNVVALDSKKHDIDLSNGLTESKNLAINSSFEYLQEGMPPFMRAILEGVYFSDEKYTDFLKNFVIDTKEKKSGNNAVRMTCGKKSPSSSGVATHRTIIIAKKAVTFSIYLKASEDNFPVTLNIKEVHHKNYQKNIIISKNWERYIFTLEKPNKANIVASMVFNKPGTVWADDIQLEMGNKATAYLPSSLDQVKCNPKSKVEIEKDIILKKIDKPLTIDGDIEDKWFKYGVKIDKFFTKAKATEFVKTEAYITCDNNNLYVAVRAYVKDPSKVKGSEGKYDNILIHSEDCIEIFLDTTFGRKTFHHFTTNAGGSKTDFGPGVILGWNGAWDSAVKINKNNKSIDYEMKFPFKLFAGLNIAEKWGINIGRNDTYTNKTYSLTHTKTGNFRVPRVFPAIVFPKGVITNVKIGLEKTNLILNKKSQVSLDIYTRYNYYMNEENAVLVGLLKLPGKFTGKITVAGKIFDVKMEPEFAIDIPLKGIKNGEHQITLDVYNGNEKIISGSTKLIKRKFKKGATQIDHQRRCLIVDGKPYLVIAPYFDISRSFTRPKYSRNIDLILSNMVRLYKEMGCKTVHIGGFYEKPILQWTQKIIDICAKEGMKVIYRPHNSYRYKITPEERSKKVNGSNIIANLILDEPVFNLKSTEAEAFMKANQEASPYTPVFMNNTLLGMPQRFANLRTDILMFDDCLVNREGRNISEMLDSAKMMLNINKESSQPAFFLIEGRTMPNQYRELTYAEELAQAYGFIIEGCSGISYYYALPKYPSNYRALVDLNRELLDLEEIIFSLEKTTDVKITDSAVKFMTRKLGNKIYIISLNSNSDRATDVEITLPKEFKYAEIAEVKFEGRKIKVKNGKISDNFKPLVRHVYVVDIAK